MQDFEDLKEEVSRLSDYNQRYDMSIKQRIKGCFYSMAGVLIILILSLLLHSCKSIQYVPVESVKTEYISKTDTFIQRDSIYHKDSVFVIKNGDTVTINKITIQYKDRWREVVKIDTVIKTDSIQVPYPVEKQLSRWDKLCMQAGDIAICMLVLIVLLIIFRFATKKFKS